MNDIKITREIKEKICAQIQDAICVLASCIPNNPVIQLFSVKHVKSPQEDIGIKITHFIPSLKKEYSILFTNQIDFAAPLIIIVIYHNGERIMLSADEFHKLKQN